MSTTTERHPQLRSTLVFAPPGRDGAVVIKDPDRGKYFRLSEPDCFIARQFDGETPPGEIRRRTEEHFGAALAPAALDAFASALRTAGLLEGEGSSASRRKRRLHGSLLRIQLRAFDPDRVLQRLLPSVRWCFSPGSLVIATAAVLIGVVLVAMNWNSLVAESLALLQLSSIPLFLIAVFAVTTAHEFAHGLTCKHFGGSVHEMGFMLIYFQPAFYCDVSDAWVIPERWKRVCISLAGPGLELVLWGVAAALWAATDAEALVHRVSLMVLACTGAHTLLNFNPFVKLDGYYMLSDLLAIPNLRRRSFAYLGGAIKRALGLDVPDPPELPAHVRRILLLYGAVASAGTFVLVGVILATAGSSLLEGQPVVVAAATGMIGMRFRRRFRRLFLAGAATKDDDDDDDDGDGGAVNAAPEPEPEPEPAPATAAEPEQSAEDQAVERKKLKRRRRQRRRRALWLAAVAAVALFIAFGRADLRIAGAFTVLPEHNADVRSGIEAIVDAVRVNEGDTVRAGDTVVMLSARDTRVQLQGTMADIQRAQARLRMLELGISPDSIALSQTLLARAKEAVGYAQSRLDRTVALSRNGFATPVDVESANERLDAAKSAVKESEDRLRIYEAGARPEVFAAARAEIAKLRAEQELLTGQLEQVAVLSPAAGIVATPERELRELRGQLVLKGALLAKVYELRSLDIEIAISEKDIGDIRVGFPVLVRALAYPGRSFAGTVTAISPAVAGTVRSVHETGASQAASSTSSVRTVVVTTSIDNADLLLKPGMTGQAKILCGERRVYQLIVRRFLNTLNLAVWSWW